MFKLCGTALCVYIFWPEPHYPTCVSSKVDMVADMLVDELTDMLANMEVDKVADMEVDMGADMEVDKVANIFKTKWIKPDIF